MFIDLGFRFQPLTYKSFSGSYTAFAPPVNTVAPAITGTGVYTCSTGTWTGTPTPMYTYQWYKENVVLAGETASTYRALTIDDGYRLTCKVTAINTVDSKSAFSAVVNMVYVAPPAWLPAGDLVYADFINGNYYADGAERLQAAFITLNETSLDGSGLLCPAVTFTGARLGTSVLASINSLLDAGFTILLDVNIPVVNAVIGLFGLYDNADPDSATGAFLSSPIDLDQKLRVYDYQSMDATNGVGLTTGASKFGCVLFKPVPLTNFASKISVNGGTVVTSLTSYSGSQHIDTSFKVFILGAEIIDVGGGLAGHISKFRIRAAATSTELQTLTI